MIPACTITNSILDGELRARAAMGEVRKIVVVTTAQGSYAAAFLTDNPMRPVYLATRRERTSPKVYIDIGRLISSIADLVVLDIPIVIQASPHPRAKRT